MRDSLKKVKRRLAGTLLPRLVSVLIRTLYATMRVRVVGEEIPLAFHTKGEGTINVFWHGRILMIPFFYRGNGLNILVSSHGDGEIVANVLASFGFHLIRGSSSKGGREAFAEMLRLARKNRDLALTPDGPRGPAEVVKAGVAQLAHRTGRPVIPLAFAASRFKQFGSWDRFMVPYPFSRGVLVWGEPLYCKEGEEAEAFRQRIEEALRATTSTADELAAP